MDEHETTRTALHRKLDTLTTKNIDGEFRDYQRLCWAAFASCVVLSTSEGRGFSGEGNNISIPLILSKVRKMIMRF